MLEVAEDALVRTSHEAGLDLGGNVADHISYFRFRAQGGRADDYDFHTRARGQDDRAADHDLFEVEEMIEDLECGLEEQDAAAARVEAMLDQLPARGRDPEVAAAAAAAEQLLDGYASSEALHSAAQNLRAAVLAAEARAPEHKRAAKKRDRDDYEGVINIREEQRSASSILDARNFNRLLRAVGEQFRADFKCTREAADALRAAAEDYLVELFHDSGRAAIHAQRTYVQPKDMNFVRNLRRTSL
jgi:histone H3/H4